MKGLFVGAVAVTLSLNACSGGHLAGARNRLAPTTPPRGTPASSSAQSWSSPAGTSVRSGLHLDATKVQTGGRITGWITVENLTGRPLVTFGCGLFAVLLANQTYHPEPNWASCLQKITIPTGDSTYPVTVTASYQMCTQGSSSATVPACGPFGTPGLPAGMYQATSYQDSQVVPTPPTIPVEVDP